MDKKRFMEEIKEDMAMIVGQMTDETVHDSLDRLDEYKRLIQLVASDRILNTERGHLEPSQQEVQEEIQEDIDQDEDQDIKNKEDDNRIPENVYELERKLAGATLKGTDIYIAESLFRKLGVSHGDLIEVEVVGTEAGSPKYRFSVYQKHEGKDTSGIEEFNYGLVKFDRGIGAYIEKSVFGDDFRIDEVPTVIRLSDNDVRDFHIKENDVVDVAWYAGSFDRVKVRWVHRDLKDEDSVGEDVGKKKIS